jgi:hypothetical protein
VSPHRPKDFHVQQQRKEKKREEEHRTKHSSTKVVEPTKVEQQTFEEIRAKIILTNEIIDNANPADAVKENALLLEMMEDIKAGEKKINQYAMLYLEPSTKTLTRRSWSLLWLPMTTSIS